MNRAGSRRASSTSEGAAPVAAPTGDRRAASPASEGPPVRRRWRRKRLWGGSLYERAHLVVGEIAGR